jgi:hypothetical protein
LLIKIRFNKRYLWAPNWHQNLNFIINYNLIKSDTLYKIIKELPGHNKLIFGDYTIVSPDYAEPTISMNIIQNVMSPKVIYTYKDNYYILRGNAFKSSKHGFDQYFIIAQDIIKQKFFRGDKYSLGDKYIHDRGIFPRLKGVKKGGNPSSWIRNTICIHITFIRNII